MTFEQFWELVAPYFQGFIGMTVAGIPVGAIIWAVVKKLVTKSVTKLLAGTSAENISQEVAKQLANSSINVDLTAVTEKQLAQIKVELTEEMANVAKVLDKHLQYQVLTLKALSASEVVSSDTKAQIVDAVESAGEKADGKKATISIELQPVKETAEESETVLSFGG